MTLKGVVSLVGLYASKAGTALVGLLVLPLLHDLLGTTAFGVVGVILSLQALAVMLDLGLAVSAGREASSMRAGEDWQLAPLVRHLDRVVVAGYAGVLAIVVAVTALAPVGITPALGAGVVLGLAGITHQNACLNGLIGRRDLGFAAFTQFAGTLVRHLLAVACLYLIAPTVEVFVYAHAAGALLQAFGNRARLLALAGPRAQNAPDRPHDRISIALAVLGAAGACALQLDKPIIGALSGPIMVAPYYLASVLALTPISFLAGPVAQFFQPTIMLARAEGRLGDMTQAISRLAAALTITTLVPAAVLWVTAYPLTRLWLGTDPIQPLVADYLRVLILGGLLGSFGLIPNILLVGERDYRFLALASVIMTTLLLAGVALAAHAGAIRTACYVYVAYHTTATLVLWVRASALRRELNGAVLGAPAETGRVLKGLGARLARLGQ